MSQLATGVAKLKGFVNANEKTLSLTLVTLLIFAVEELTNKEFYVCPAKNYGLYGGFLLVVPVCCLISLVFITLRSKPFCDKVFRSLIVSWIWLIFAFGETDVLVCTVRGPKTAQTEVGYAEIRGISQMLALAMLFAIAFVCLVYYCSQKAPVLPEVEKFDILACEAAVGKMNDEIEKLAKAEAEEMCTIVTNEGGKDLRELVGEKLNAVAEKYPRAAKGFGKKYRVEKDPPGPSNNPI